MGTIVPCPMFQVKYRFVHHHPRLLSTTLLSTVSPFFRITKSLIKLIIDSDRAVMSIHLRLSVPNNGRSLQTPLHHSITHRFPITLSFSARRFYALPSQFRSYADTRLPPFTKDACHHLTTQAWKTPGRYR